MPVPGVIDIDKLDRTYPNMSAVVRLYAILYNRMMHLHADDRTAREGEAAAVQLLSFEDLPLILRARALMVLSCNPDHLPEAADCAREAIQIIDEYIRPDTQNFPQKTYDEACKLLADIEAEIREKEEAKKNSGNELKEDTEHGPKTNSEHRPKKNPKKRPKKSSEMGPKKSSKKRSKKRSKKAA